MPKNNKVVKRDGRVFKERVPSKFRIGNRKSTKSANGMSTQALKDELNNPNHKKARNKIIAVLRNRGVEFLTVPASYYEEVLDRVGEIDEDLAPLRDLGILVDRDDEGYLLQIFTKPILDRPTMFIEIIQRKGAKSFGKGNFKALFESIEREQASRGTL